MKQNDVLMIPLYSITGNFLMICSRMLNFKFSFLILKFKKYRVGHFVHSPVHVTDK
jgi:hypothetical protein